MATHTEQFNAAVNNIKAFGEGNQLAGMDPVAAATTLVLPMLSSIARSLAAIADVMEGSGE
jgi:hypothetical protein